MLVLCLTAFEMRSQQWEISYPVEEGIILSGGCCNGGGNYVLGSCNRMVDDGYSDALAMYIADDGSFVERMISFDGCKANLCQGLCLDNGNAVVAGVKGGSLDDHVFDSLWIAVMTPELDILEEYCKPIEEPYCSWTGEIFMDYNSDGDIVVLAGASRFSVPYMMYNGVYVVLKCDTHGNVLKVRYLEEGHSPKGARPTGIASVPGTDNMMLLGCGFNIYGFHTVAYIDNELELVGAYPLPWLEDKCNYTNCWKSNGRFLMSSLTHHYQMPENQFYTAVFEVDEEGHYFDTLVYDRSDTSDYPAQYGSMAYVSDGVIYIATYWENGLNETPSDAVICLIDSELNLQGTKKIRVDDTKIRIRHCQKTSDGGCLVYGQCKKSNSCEMLYVWKLLPEDFVIPWTLSDTPEVLPPYSAYPDPTSDYLNIYLNSIEKLKIKVSVFNENGQKSFELRFDGGGLLTLDVSSLDCGAYFYEVSVGGRCTQKGKFLKN